MGLICEGSVFRPALSREDLAGELSTPSLGCEALGSGLILHDK